MFAVSFPPRSLIMAERHTSSDNDDYDAAEQKPVIPKTEPSSPIPSSSQEKLYII